MPQLPHDEVGTGSTGRSAAGGVPSSGPAPGAGTGRHGVPSPPDEVGTDLVDALVLLRGAVAEVRLPLDEPGADEARRVRAEMLAQLDDYLLPRLRAVSAPVLAVLGGSTGAGKSTLLNSLLGSPVSAAGVLRPTTRWPVLVHHPLDAQWFEGDRVLPGLARLRAGQSSEPVAGHDQGPSTAGPSTAGRTTVGESTAGEPTAGLRLVASSALPQGLAILDAPDVDSVVEENRRLSRQLLGSADLWLFVTTASRYADAVPWELLETAAERRTQLALVLDRVDAQETTQVLEHLRAMLTEHGLGGVDVLVVPEAELVDGLLPEPAVAAVADWLTALAADPSARRDVVARTRDGLLSDLLSRCGRLASMADAQRAADERLRGLVDAAYAAAGDEVRHATSDASMLRGEVLARWQELVGTGELMRSIEEGVSRLRDRLAAMVRGRRSAAPPVVDAISSGLDTVILDAAERAAERAFLAWRADPAGASLLAGLELSRSSTQLRAQVAEQVRGWQEDVLGLVDREGAGRRTQARALSYGVNALGVALMLVVFSSTAGLTGAEVGIAGGTALLAQRLLEAVFGDDAVRRLTVGAHGLLDARVVTVLAEQAARFTGALDGAGAAGDAGDLLRAAVARVERSPLPEDPAPLAQTAAGRLRGAGVRVDAPRGEPGPRAAGDQPRAGGLRGWWRRLTGGRR